MNRYIQDYIDLVRSGTELVCREQFLLVDLVEKAFQTENIYVDESQLERYMDQQKYFPYRLLDWETFVFALHNCVYKAPARLRWPNALIVVARGAGKNGYLAFEDFCLVTPVNGIEKYDVDIFATSEEQAKATFNDIYDILESNEAFFKKYFSWNKEEIVNKKTKSHIRYNTSSAKTKDGMRPGKVDFDEIHAYPNPELIDVAVTGLGKKPMPRRTYITTMGNVRDGPLDRMLETALKVLEGLEPDNGWLYFICRLDSDDEIDDEAAWVKANPSLHDPTRPELLDEIRAEYVDYKRDPISNSAFATKRMNRPRGNPEAEVTSWDNIKAANNDYPTAPDDSPPVAVFGIDYADTRDFAAAGILWKVKGVWCWWVHSWICAQSPTLHRLKFPYMDAVAKGEATMVEEPLIPMELLMEWISKRAEEFDLRFGAIDHFRVSLVRKALRDEGWDTDPKKGNVKLTYRPEESQIAPLLTKEFINHNIRWGDSMTMRWYTNNTCRKADTNGNITFEKIEPITRKTDGFKALVAAFIVATKEEKIFEELPDIGDLPDVFIY